MSHIHSLQAQAEDELKLEDKYSRDPAFDDERQLAQAGIRHDPTTGLYFKADRIVVPNVGNLRKHLIKEFHDTPFSAHVGASRTYHALSRRYYWRGMKNDVRTYVQQCPSCQRNKVVRQPPAGPLHPLPVPDTAWDIITMDFVTGLPPTTVDKYNTILTVVDKYSRQVHLIPCHDTVDSAGLARLFIREIFRLHGIPYTIITDRGPQFRSDFTTELMLALGTTIRLSSAHHPQTDGQTERYNAVVEEALRHYVQDACKNWDVYLPLLEFALNNSVNATTGVTPFFANTCTHPNVPLDIHHQLPKKQYTRDFLDTWAQMQARVHDAIYRAQQNQKRYYDRKVKPLVFDIGDQVLLNTKNLSLGIDVFPHTRKFRDRFTGPYTILDRYNPQSFTPPDDIPITVYSAYKLDLGTTTLHNVFHVDLLRPYHANPDFHEEPPPLEDHQEYYAVERVAQHRYRKYGASNPRLELQVYWLGYDRPTWVPASHVTADVLTDYRQDQNLELPLFQKVKRQRGGKCND